jgi:Restriction Enzyme Adenine Methylase Associated
VPRATSDTSLDDLIQAGLIRPPLQIERTYKGVHLTGVVQQDGKVEFGGQIYDSLSTAAGMARRSVIGSPTGRPYPQTNGWTFWMYRSENDALSEIDRITPGLSGSLFSGFLSSVYAPVPLLIAGRSTTYSKFDAGGYQGREGLHRKQYLSLLLSLPVKHQHLRQFLDSKIRSRSFKDLCFPDNLLFYREAWPARSRLDYPEHVQADEDS